MYLGRRGQSAVEYAVFISVVVAALIAMGTYVQRAIQANLKVTEDQINAEAVTTPQPPGPGPVPGPGPGPGPRPRPIPKPNSD